MNVLLFAAETAKVAEELHSENAAPLGLNMGAFIVQLITFVLVFLVLKRFAFTPIINLLEKRRVTIDEGVTMGVQFEQERDLLNKNVKKVMRDARKEADKIITNGHKEARDILRNAESAAKRKSDAMFADAEARIDEETKQSRKKLENEIIELVAEATEAVVGEKVDAKKDAHIIKNVLHKRTKAKN